MKWRGFVIAVFLWLVVGITVAVRVGAEHFTERSAVVRRYGACGSAIAICVRATVSLGGRNSCAISVVYGERGCSIYFNGAGAVKFSI
jgi:hypothetical protein